MFGYGNYNFMNMLGSSSLMSNAFSPATQMCFQGTNSIFNLGNWNVYGGSSYCGGCTGYSNGQILGYSAAMGLGFIGSILLNSWASKKMAQASQPTAKQQANNAVREMNNLAKQIGADNWEEALEPGYKSSKLTDELIPAQRDAEKAIKDAKAEVDNTTTGLTAQENALANKEGEIAGKQAEIDALDKSSPTYATDVSKLKTELARLNTEKQKIEKEIKRLEDLKESTEKGGKLYEANEKAKEAIKTEENRIADIQEKIENIRDTKYEQNQQVVDADTLDDQDGGFLGRNPKQEVMDKADRIKAANGTSTETVYKADLRRAIYLYRKANATDRPAAKERFLTLYEQASKDLQTEFKDSYNIIKNS